MLRGDGDETSGPRATISVDGAPVRQEPWGVQQSRDGPAPSLTGSPSSCGESDGSMARAEAGTRQKPTAPVQA